MDCLTPIPVPQFIHETRRKSRRKRRRRPNRCYRSSLRTELSPHAARAVDWFVNVLSHDAPPGPTDDDSFIDNLILDDPTEEELARRAILDELQARGIQLRYRPSYNEELWWEEVEQCVA